MYLNLITKDNAQELHPKVIDLLEDYFKEVHQDIYIGTKSRIVQMIQKKLFRENNSFYILNTDKGEPIGFLIVYIHDQYGITPPNLFVDYMYITPSHRSGKAVMMLYSMVGDICMDLGMDALGSTFVTSSNQKNNKLVGGEVLAEVTYFPRDRFIEKLNKFNKRIK